MKNDLDFRTESIGEIIRVIRRKKNVTQLELARATDLTQGFISQLEKGVKNPTLEVLEKIADYLKVPVFLLVYLNHRNNKTLDLSEDDNYSDFVNILYANLDVIASLFLNLPTQKEEYLIQNRKLVLEEWKNVTLKRINKL